MLHTSQNEPRELHPNFYNGGGSSLPIQAGVVFTLTSVFGCCFLCLLDQALFPKPSSQLDLWAAGAVRFCYPKWGREIPFSHSCIYSTMTYWRSTQCQAQLQALKESMEGKRCHSYPPRETDINQISNITIVLMCYGEDVRGDVEGNKANGPSPGY